MKTKQWKSLVEDMKKAAKVAVKGESEDYLKEVNPFSDRAIDLYTALFLV